MVNNKTNGMIEIVKIKMKRENMLKRPNYNFDNEDLKAIAESIYKDNSNEYASCSITEDMLYEVIKRDRQMNGYEYAKALEDLGAYDIDSYIVENLDYINTMLYELNKVNVKNWVKENNIKPIYKVGDLVKYKSFNSLETTNYIKEIDLEEGIYKIKMNETQSALVPFENVYI